MTRHLPEEPRSPTPPDLLPVVKGLSGLASQCRSHEGMRCLSGQTWTVWRPDVNGAFGRLRAMPSWPDSWLSWEDVGSQSQAWWILPIQEISVNNKSKRMT